MSQLMEYELKVQSTAPNIHPTAIIDPRAQIHHTVVIGPYCVIEGVVIIEAGTVIMAHVHIKGPLTIGKGNKIYPFASVGCDSQDKKYKQDDAYLSIGDHNTIREYVTISRGNGGEHLTKIGSHNLFMTYVHIAHDCHIGDHNTLSNNASLAGHVEMGSYIGLGGFTAVHQFTRIGSYAFTGGASLISKDIPPYMMVSHGPARLVGINVEGLKRRGFSDEQRRALKNIYATLFRKSTSILDTAQQLLQEPLQEREIMLPLLEFLLSSSRGITR